MAFVSQRGGWMRARDARALASGGPCTAAGGDDAYGPTVTIFATDGTPDPLMRKSM